MWSSRNSKNLPSESWLSLRVAVWLIVIFNVFPFKIFAIFCYKNIDIIIPECFAKVTQHQDKFLLSEHLRNMF